MFKLGAVKATELGKQFDKLAKALSPPETATLMTHGAEVIAEQARRNIQDQGLVDTGDLLNSVEVYKVNQYSAGIRVGVIHAAVHEFGLFNHPITPRQRRFFWAMHRQTGDPMWKALALSATYTIPSRPYLRPAIDTEKQSAIAAIVREGAKMLKRAAGRSP